MMLASILDRLECVRKSGPGYLARCPSHEDRTASLSIGEGDDGTILLNCFAGCTMEAVCDALNLKPTDLFPSMRNGNGNHSSAKASQAPEVESKFAGTDEMVDRLQTALARSPECQQYIEGRGVSLKVAAELKWGFSPARSFAEEHDNLVQKPALAIPHYIGGNLMGIKFRTIDGTKLFTQMPGSSISGLYGTGILDRDAHRVLVLEGPEDVALAASHGFNATGIIAAGVVSASSKLSNGDVRLLSSYARIYLVGDQDIAGQKSMDAAAAQLPPEKVIRVRLRGVKDIGDLYAGAPAEFEHNLKQALRIGDIQRQHFTLEDLETESEIMAGGTGELPFLVDGLIPLDDFTMFAGKEGSLKTLLALYIGKCVANGEPVFGRFKTRKKPVVYLDAENHHGTHQVYLRFFQGVGSEEIHFRTLRYGVPALTDAALLRLCEMHRPLLILDSLIRFGGSRDRDGSEMTELMEQIARLVTAGATVVLIHHSRRSNEEEYANSFAIGATVAFWYAIVKEGAGPITGIRMVHKKSRGSVQINRSLIAFPAILTRGRFELDEADKHEAELHDLIEFLRSQPGQACSKETIKQRRGRRAEANLKLLDLAIERSLLIVRKDRKVAFPSPGTTEAENIPFPSAGTNGNAEAES